MTFIDVLPPPSTYLLFGSFMSTSDQIKKLLKEGESPKEIVTKGFPKATVYRLAKGESKPECEDVSTLKSKKELFDAEAKALEAEAKKFEAQNRREEARRKNVVQTFWNEKNVLRGKLLDATNELLQLGDGITEENIEEKYDEFMAINNEVMTAENRLNEAWDEALPFLNQDELKSLYAEEGCIRGNSTLAESLNVSLEREAKLGRFIEVIKALKDVGVVRTEPTTDYIQAVKAIHDQRNKAAVR